MLATQWTICEENLGQTRPNQHSESLLLSLCPITFCSQCLTASARAY